METVGYKIKSTREALGLTQGELADQLNLSLRTIQRIETGEENIGRKSLQMVLDFLNISGTADDKSEPIVTDNLYGRMLKVLILIAINFAIVLIFGYLTLDSEANFNSRCGSLIIAILGGLLVTQNTSRISSFQRVLRFGSGSLIYVLVAIILHGFVVAWITFLIPCVTIYVLALTMDRNFMSWISSNS